ncbi:MAG: hypothetical protein JWQ57_2524 [Mucilaginibacter sp.]|nr:hypothetical protein [Mucilaginibacter sp.]
MQTGYFLTLPVLINITAIHYACVCYPVDPYFNCTSTAMQAIITTDKGSDQVAYRCNFPFIAFTRSRLSSACIYNFNVWFTCRY